MFLEYHDARRMLDTSVVVYEGRLTYITKVNPDNTVDMVDCETGERFIGMADFDMIENPANSRIGYINSARFAHDAAYGYIDVNSIDDVYDNNKNAMIQMKTGREIQTRQSLVSLKKMLLYARVAKDIYKERNYK